MPFTLAIVSSQLSFLFYWTKTLVFLSKRGHKYLKIMLTVPFFLAADVGLAGRGSVRVSNSSMPMSAHRKSLPEHDRELRASLHP